MLVGGYLNRERLNEAQAAAIRYGAALAIYLSSTADIILTGVAQAPWLPLVLAGLSIGGVFAGILLRVRGFLFLGLGFLALAIFTVIRYAAVDLRQTWIWWASGIVAGVLILALFAYFEKKREEILRLAEQLKQWQPDGASGKVGRIGEGMLPDRGALLLRSGRGQARPGNSPEDGHRGKEPHVRQRTQTATGPAGEPRRGPGRDGGRGGRRHRRQERPARRRRRSRRRDCPRDNLLVYRGPSNEPEPVKTVADWQKRRAEILEGMQAVMGRLPGDEKRCPLEMKVEEEVDCGTYVRRLITYASEPGSRVPAYLLIPKELLQGDGKKAPAVLCLHGTDNVVGHGVVVGAGQPAEPAVCQRAGRAGIRHPRPELPAAGQVSARHQGARLGERDAQGRLGQHAGARPAGVVAVRGAGGSSARSATRWAGTTRSIRPSSTTGSRSS